MGITNNDIEKTVFIPNKLDNHNEYYLFQYEIIIKNKYIENNNLTKKHTSHLRNFKKRR